ncbi:MAG: RNase adapter RapZ [Pseudomonadota bacterium]
MRLTIVSGLSGSGKSVALHTLEDEGYYCVDNLPVNLVPSLIAQLRESRLNLHENVAVGIDARAETTDLKAISSTLEQLRESGIDVEILFLQTDTSTLIRRFNETRRKHPLSGKNQTLEAAIEEETRLLAELIDRADIIIDTTELNLHLLRHRIANIVVGRANNTMSVQFQSFGFKFGVPNDTDFVFDVRCLPNPHWEPELRKQSGRDQAVIEYLDGIDSVNAMLQSIETFLGTWIPQFKAENRAFMTVSIGCTGGQHRSVYLVEKLRERFSNVADNVSLTHRELSWKNPS